MYWITRTKISSALIIQMTIVLTVTSQMNLTPNGTATQSSFYNDDESKGKPENALYPPISNEYNLSICSHTKEDIRNVQKAWWRFQFSFGLVYITDITIYYRENYAHHMNGFKIFVTNTTTSPSEGYLCYEDPKSNPLPNITQTVPCYQLGKYVVYYDNVGSEESDQIYLPIVELCYVAINGCPKSFWGSNCDIPCAENCWGQHCFPGNGSCVFGGCSNTNCLNNKCDKDTQYCFDGCKANGTGPFCDTYAECFVDPMTSVMSCSPRIEKVFPSTGPVNGGTLLTISGQNLVNATPPIFFQVSGVECLIHNLLTPGISFTCVIGKGKTNDTKGIHIFVNGKVFYEPRISYYSFKEPKLHEVSPMKGIVAGNTTVTIRGSDIGFEGQNRYKISFCNIENCTKCSALQNTMNTSFIKCKTGKSEEPQNMTQMQIVIDDLTVLTLNVTFQYIPDPTFNISTLTAISIESGGVTFTIRGEGFNNVGEITVERVIKPCIVSEDTSAVCETPPRIQFKQNNQTVRVYFDGFILLVFIQYVYDPTFERFSNVLEYDKESSIQIKGRNILNLVQQEDYIIHIGLDGKCVITDVSMSYITCLPPKSVPRTNKTDVNTVHVIVEVKKIMAYIGDLQYTEDDNDLQSTEDDNDFPLLVRLLIGGLVTSVIIGISAISILRRNKTRAVKKWKLEMSKGLSERQANVRNNLEHIEENESSTYCEINPDNELQSDTNINKHPDINAGYEHLANRSQKDPYNQLNQESADNQIGDMINVDDRTEDSPVGDYIDIES